MNFIPSYASLAAPLEKLRSQKSLQLADLELTAFQNLKDAILHAPVLSLPYFDHPFHVATDASASGSGAVLYQLIDKKQHSYNFKLDPCQNLN